MFKNKIKLDKIKKNKRKQNKIDLLHLYIYNNSLYAYHPFPLIIIIKYYILLKNFKYTYFFL